MMNKIKKIFYSVSSTMLLLPAVVAAQYSVPNAPTGVGTDVNANDLILRLVNWFLTFLASLSILMIIIAGIMYITSGGDEGRVDTAKKWLTYSIVGLVVALLGYVIVRTVSGALTGS